MALVIPSLYLRLVAHIMVILLEQCAMLLIFAIDLRGFGTGLRALESYHAPLNLGLVLCRELCKFVVLFVVCNFMYRAAIHCEP